MGLGCHTSTLGRLSTATGGRCGLLTDEALSACQLFGRFPNKVRLCGADAVSHGPGCRPFSTTTVGYEDNVTSWPSAEPADDYTADSLLAFALAAGSGGDGHGAHA